MGEHFNLDDLEQGEERDEEEAEEALSLRDLLLDNKNYSVNNASDSQNTSGHGSHTPPRSSSSDLFEFFHDFSIDMCRPAEEIIVRGKLVPLKDHYYSVLKPITKDKRRTDFTSKRSESLSEIPGFRSSSSIAKAKLMRNSRSLDYGKDREMMMERSSSTKPKPPRWYYVFMFGISKIPTEMELTDIKNRQSRQNPSTLFPPLINNNNDNNTSRCGIRKGSYRLIRVLSCKNDASVAVATTPFAWQG